MVQDKADENDLLGGKTAEDIIDPVKDLKKNIEGSVPDMVEQPELFILEYEDKGLPNVLASLDGFKVVVDRTYGTEWKELSEWAAKDTDIESLNVLSGSSNEMVYESSQAPKWRYWEIDSGKDIGLFRRQFVNQYFRNALVREGISEVMAEARKESIGQEGLPIDYAGNAGKGFADWLLETDSFTEYLEQEKDYVIPDSDEDSDEYRKFLKEVAELELVQDYQDWELNGYREELLDQNSWRKIQETEAEYYSMLLENDQISDAVYILDDVSSMKKSGAPEEMISEYIEDQARLYSMIDVQPVVLADKGDGELAEHLLRDFKRDIG